MARGRRGVYKAEKRKKELKRQAKQEAKRKRRMQKAAGIVPEDADNGDAAEAGESREAPSTVEREESFDAE